MEMQDSIHGFERSPANDNGRLDLDHFTEVVEYLTALRTRDQGSYRARNVDIRQRQISQAEPQQLFAWMNQSGERDWQLHPSFYDALIAEIRRRGLLES